MSPLTEWLAERNSPELQYIETKWASLMAYGVTADLLKDVLPVGETLNAATVRHHLQRVAQRQDSELAEKPDTLTDCPAQWGNCRNRASRWWSASTVAICATGTTARRILKSSPANRFPKRWRQNALAWYSNVMTIRGAGNRYSGQQTPRQREMVSVAWQRGESVRPTDRLLQPAGR